MGDKKGRRDTPAGNIQPERNETIRTLLICIALAVVTFIAFEGVRKNDFVNYDDDFYVTNNEFVQEGLSSRSIAWAFTTWHMGNWHPLTWISHIIDCSIFGLNPAGHHLVSVGLHIVNVVLLFLILKRMTRATWPSAFAAAMFGLHPLAVESVAWIAERKNVLSTFFAFLTIGAYFWYTQKPGLWRYVATALAFAAGLLSKPMLVTLPFVLILLDYWPTGRFKEERGLRWFWRAAVEKLPLLVMSVIICVVTYKAQAGTGAVSDIVSLPLGLRVGNAFVSYIQYIEKIFYPASLAPLYPLDLKGPALWQICVSAVLLFTLTAAVIERRRRHRFMFTGWLWYLGTLVPVIGLIQVGSQSIADRYMYLPGIGIYIIIAWIAGEATAKLRLPKVIPAAVGALIIVLLLLATRVQVGYWKSSLSLSEHALAITQNNHIMHTNAGTALMGVGRIDEAIEHFRRALAINPIYVEARDDLGCALQEKGLDTEAAAEFEDVLRLKPNNATARNNYGFTLSKLGRYDEAIAQFTRALELGTGFSNTLMNMCRTGVKGGKIDEVLGIIKHWEQKTPGNAELYCRAGMLYLMKSQADQAIEQLETACRLTEDNEPEPLDLLSQAYAAKGKTGSAVEAAQKALDAANKKGKKELAGQIKKRLELYQQTGKPKE
jgi:tetratricopeptide (TPR) repeat protein